MKGYSLNTLGLALALFAANAFATDGYFAHGYGVKSQGMGGVGIALPQDSIAAASNPAGMGIIGNRFDSGVTWFRPQREVEITGNAFPGVNGKYNGNDSQDFFIPEFGYNHQINDKLTAGMSVYGNGGMNTNYVNGIPLYGSRGHAGVDLAQLFIAPTGTWKVTPTQTLGISVNFTYQRFLARGLQGFDNPNFTTSTGNVTDRGHSHSIGAGFHLGYLGQFFDDKLTVGLSYQSRTYMSKFKQYEGLFAGQGDFDVPSSYGLSAAFKATPQWTLAADVLHINYSEVESVGRLSLPNLGYGLGSDNGAGFGWRNVTAVKFGTSYAVDDKLTLRIGYNHSSQPVRQTDTFFNILAPGVVQDHITAGVTYVLPNKGEISLAYMHAFENTVYGSNSIPPGFPPTGLGGGNANLSMYQDSVGIAYGLKF